MSPPRPATDVDALRAALLTHARAVIAREGMEGLTMRALAGEAGMAVGMSYKAFTSRDDLLRELAWISLHELAAGIEDWATRPGGRLADRLMEFADLVTASDAPALVSQLSRVSGGEELLREAVEDGVVRSWAAVMTEFLQQRQSEGSVRREVDVEAFGFLLTAALHYLLITAEPFPAPGRDTLARYVGAIADQIS